MRIVIQKVTKSELSVEGRLFSSIGQGLLVLVGIECDDNDEDIEYLVKKICNMRIFEDKDDIMNLSVKDVDGEIMAVSQFTLMARTKKGNRPSYIDAANPSYSRPMYEKFVVALQKGCGKPIKTGEFGANMQISLVNDGPTTIIVDSKNKH